MSDKAKSIGFSKGVLLHFKRGPFGQQNESFWKAKRVLLQCKRSPFSQSFVND